MSATEHMLQAPGTAALTWLTSHPASTQRFTLDGGGELELALARTCEAVRTGVQRIVPKQLLEALVLGGGYGRGEGGVLKTHRGDRPYNDLEFYVLVRGNGWINQRRYSQALHRLGEDLASAAEVEVEFKLLPRARLKASPPSMFYYDLAAGHRQLWGTVDWLSDCSGHLSPRHLPLSEATRLMMNRCSGLLFARERLRQESLSAEDADFVGRNLAKAELAFGDAVLTAFNQYHWSCLERHRRLRQLAKAENTIWLESVRQHHAAGVRFKLHPQRTAANANALHARFTDISALALQVWLWLESRRLDHRFASALEYALCRIDKCPETEAWRNRLVNANLFGPLAWFQPMSVRHPRERVLNALSVLLWESHRPQTDWLLPLQKQLRISSKENEVLVQLYKALWRRLS